MQDDGRVECGYVEDGFFWSCPSRCCEKGKGCPGECLDNPTETSYSGQPTSASDTPSTATDGGDDDSCPSGCQKKPKEDDSFFVRKEMLVVYAIMMGMPLMVWFTSLDVKIKSFVTLFYSWVWDYTSVDFITKMQTGLKTSHYT